MLTTLHGRKIGKKLICESSFTWVRDSLMMSSANNEEEEGVNNKACLTEAREEGKYDTRVSLRFSFRKAAAEKEALA